jgi:hypothetical protein
MHQAIGYHLAHARTAALRHDARSDTRSRGVPGTAYATQPAVAGNDPLAESAPRAARPPRT